MSNENIAYNYAQRLAEAIEALATCADEYRAAWEEWQDDTADNHKWDAAYSLLDAAGLEHMVGIYEPDDRGGIGDNGIPDPDDVEDATEDWWSEGILDVQVLADLANGNSLHEVRCAITLGGPDCWIVWDGIRSWIDCHWGGEHSVVSVPSSAQDWITTGMQIYAANAGADY